MGLLGQTQPRGGEDDRASLPEDTKFDILGNERRRVVIDILAGVEESIDLRELATRVAARERDCEEVELSYNDRKSVRVALYQAHLPKLVEAGVVEYDKRSREVTPTARVDELAAYLEYTPTDTPQCSRACLLRAMAGGAVLAAAATLLLVML